MTAVATPPKRSAAETRRAMLDAALKRLEASGPGALRLQDVAADVGVSHPAVLHHFGSREGLVQAVIERGLVSLQDDLVRAFTDMGNLPPNGAALFERVFETLADNGHARLIAWLQLSGYDPFDSPAVRENWKRILEATHALRPAVRGRKKPSYEDTQFTVVLSALALFGQAIGGRGTFAAAGLPASKDHQKKFRAWLAELLARHLGEGSSREG